MHSMARTVFLSSIMVDSGAGEATSDAAKRTTYRIGSRPLRMQNDVRSA